MEIQKMQNEIERLSHVNQLILDSVAEGIYGIDLNAKVILWNKAAESLTGYAITDFESDNLHNLIHHTNREGEHIPLQQCPVYHALNSGENLFIKDDIFWRKDGSYFPVEYTANPMIEQGKHVGMVITFRDMTEKKKTDEILLQWEKLSLVGQMAAGVAHEIRNPVTSLKGFFQLMRANKEYNDSYFDIMDSEFNRIESIIKELLMFSKPHESHYTNQKIASLIEEVIMLMEPQALIKNINIATDYDTSSEAMVYCIEHQLKQVFINLIKNALEAMENGGTIVIKVQHINDEFLIQVTDDGAGIPDDVIEKLGEPFYSTKENGTGLGLMVTNNIIKNNHQGAIHVESQLGKGTTFTVRLPNFENM
ncbi:ATP-binding protein [Halalkalibacter urbisdiaboli]|uniref:ATP-binding protein n=1 Tax=Halalkalibacter urbisdiaboli TaxID=1960589 RepID=UPI000B454705|nr:ATP-binding protein [Halalkalibacter urbisdiaboli]